MTPKPTKTPLLGVYARQSVLVDEGIDQQVKACHDEAKRRGWRVVDDYLDNATSATKPRGAKSDWARMLRDIDAGRIDTVMVVAVDRLLRRLVDVFEIKQRNVRVVVVRGGVDTAEPYGSFTLSMLVLLAEQEIETKSARAVPFRVERHAKGIPTAGRPPYGYRWIPAFERAKLEHQESRWRVEPDEADAVRLMFSEALATDKANLFGIVQTLNGSARRPPAGKRWHSSTVRRMLLNPAYAGLLAPTTTKAQREVEGYNHHAENVSIDDCTEGDWEGLVSVDQLRAVRARLTDSTRATNTGQTARKWLLGGLALCAVCDIPVRSARTREGFHGYRCPAGHFLRRGEVIDLFVATKVMARLMMPDARNLLAPPSPDIDMPALRARKESLLARRGELGKLVASGTYTAAQVDELVIPIDADLAEVDAEMTDATASDPLDGLVGLPDHLTTWVYWRNLSLARQRAVVDALAVVRIAPVGKGVRVVDPESAARSVEVRWHDTAEVLAAARDALA